MKRLNWKTSLAKGRIAVVLMAGMLLYGCSGHDTKKAPGDRLLQQVDLRHPDNGPYFSNSHMLTKRVNEGIKAGAIRPLIIDYEAGSVKAISVTDYNKLLELPAVKNAPGEEGPARIHPFELSQVVLDVSRQNGKNTAIHYLNFRAKDTDTGREKYYFSVSFPELAGYLNEKGSLWVKNASPLVWKNQVLHTDTRYTDELLPGLYQDKDTYNLVRFSGKKPSQKEVMEIYSYDYELMQKEDYKKIAPASPDNEIQLMSEALLEGRYTIGNETPVSTAVPEPGQQIRTFRKPDQFVVIQKEEVDMEHPANRQFFQPDQEFSALIIRAYEAGLLKDVYHSDSLNRKMTREEWTEKISIKGSFTQGAGAAKLRYMPKQISVLQIGWKTSFNQKGEIMQSQPHVLTLWVNPDYHPAGLMMPVGSFPFSEVEKAIRQLPEYKKASGNMLSDLRNRSYFAYFVATSGIQAAHAAKAI